MPADMTDLLQQFLPDMMDTISESENQTREMGFMICKNEDGSLHREGLCVGEECDIELKDCETGSNHADFHTHPTGIVDAHIDPTRILLAINRGWDPMVFLRGLNPSSGDLFCSWLRDVEASCIGNARGVCCHEAKQYEEMTELDRVFVDEISQNRADWVVGVVEENPAKIAKALSWYRTLTELMEIPHKEKFYGDTVCRIDNRTLGD